MKRLQTPLPRLTRSDEADRNDNHHNRAPAGSEERHHNHDDHHTDAQKVIIAGERP